MMFAGPTGGDSDPQSAVTIPLSGFNKVIRCSYWINSYNPIGGTITKALPLLDLYYTVSVGWGPDPAGAYTQPHKMASIRYSTRTIVAADGVYMGRQSVDQFGMANGRIGYRHSASGGQAKSANACFADGHCENLGTNQFPCSFSATYYGNITTLAQQKAINLGGPTVYANPEIALSLSGL
jgi:prepilin-type processing-associated H-X9-DG protein